MVFQQVVDADWGVHGSLRESVFAKGCPRLDSRRRGSGMVMRLHMIAGGPEPAAPFSHAVGPDVLVTGQMPDAPAALPDGIVAQTHAVMANLRLILAGLGLGFEHVVMARICLTRFQVDYAAMNEAYAGHFAEGRRPARTCVDVTGLAYEALIEIDLVARRP